MIHPHITPPHTPKNPSTHRRQSVRSPWQRPALLTFVGAGGHHPVTTRNISLGGVMVRGLDFPASLGIEGRLRFFYEAEVEAGLGHIVNDTWMHVRVQWNRSGRTGLSFVHLTDDELAWVNAFVEVAEERDIDMRCA